MMEQDSCNLNRAKNGRIKSIIYRTLELKELMNACEKITPCKSLLAQLNDEIPLGANYHHTIKTWPVNDFSGKELVGEFVTMDTFNGYNYESCFFRCAGSRKPKFTATLLTFQEHINIDLLQSGCALLITETQGALIHHLYELKKEMETQFICSQEDIYHCTI